LLALYSKYTIGLPIELARVSECAPIAHFDPEASLRDGKGRELHVLRCFRGHKSVKCEANTH